MARLQTKPRVADSGFVKRDSSKTTNEPSGATPSRPQHDYKPNAATCGVPLGQANSRQIASSTGARGGGAGLPGARR